MEDSALERKKRKEEGKRQKRQRIAESGGVRPRKKESKKDSSLDDKKTTSFSSNTKSFTENRNNKLSQSNKNGRQQQQYGSSRHRFGRVMEKVPCRNKPRFTTVSIAIPGSVVANCQTRELKTQICGQIARAATIYHIDEIIVFDDKLSSKPSSRNNTSSSFHHNRDNDRRKQHHNTDNDVNKEDDDNDTRPRQPPSEPHEFMARILQYCECPQYLRRHFFPMHYDLQYAGLLAPIDAPHHVRAEDRSPYREGVVLEKTYQGNNVSLVNCGIRNRPVAIDQRLQPGIRCTVQIDPTSYGRPGQMHGKVVSPTTVTRTDGTYWGYTVRLASSIKAVFDECPYGDKYDLTIGTSERGNDNVDDPNFTLYSKNSIRIKPITESSSYYDHALIVFGGVAGIEECVDADESMKLSGSASSTMFDKWVNICPYQGSRTIRSEEAVLIALAKLTPFLHQDYNAMTTQNNKSTKKIKETTEKIETPVLLNDDTVSEESSDDDSSSSDSSSESDD